MKQKKLFIVDGHALCYRAYYAFAKNPLINSRGQNTSAIFGFARMVLKLIEDQRPDYLAVAFDPPGRSFRFDTYPEYKANRQKMPEDLKSQIEEIRALVDALGIRRLETDGYEADDILGTVARRYASKSCAVVLVTGDKDAYQLVDENVTIYANRKGITEHELYDRAAVREKLGVDVEQVIDYMALVGDASDNIPGVKGIGEKTALKLIAAHGSLDGVYRELEKVTGKTHQLLEEGRAMAELSRDLVTIRTDIPLDAAIDDLAFTGLTPAARDYFEKLEMGSIARDFFPEGEAAGLSARTAAKDYRVIRSEEELSAMIAAVRAAGVVSMDTETTALSPVDADLVGMSFSIAEGAGWYLPLIGSGLFSEVMLPAEQSLALVKPLLEDPAVAKVGQNIKYDVIVLAGAGVTVRGLSFDTMVASYLLNPNERRHNMDDLALDHLGYKTITFKELTGTGKNAVPLVEVPLADLAEYATEDADITWRLYRLFEPRLAEQELAGLFRDVEMPLVPVLAAMEQAGVKIDLAHFAKLEHDNAKLLAVAEQEIFRIAGTTFNVNSTRELAHVLFEKLGLKPQKKTKTGFSTDASVLESLRGQHEMIDHLLDYRTLSKLRGTYIEALPRLVSPRTGRIHTSYNQTVAATGRLSSSDPNLQNIPVRDELGKAIRRGFVPEKGFVMLAADYSQIELRIAAHLSGDAAMRKAFQEGIDIHAMTAASVFGVPMDTVTSDMRRQAKIINFATIYGVSPYGLSQQAEIGMKEAAEFIARYFESYPGMRDYIDRTVAFAREHGYVKTMLGRRRAIAEIDASNPFRREGAERMAINTPIQGTAADMIKVAMIALHRDMAAASMRSRMIMQVHDELVFEAASDELDDLQAMVRARMEGALPLDIPVVVDMASGANWDEAH